MNDLIINLFKYFAGFVPKSELAKIFIQPLSSRNAGYSLIKAEVMASGNERVIPELEKYVFSINENFVSEKIKNSKSFILFVEYGKMSYNPEIAKGMQQTVAVSVAHHFSDTNNDNPNEALLMNRCLELLTGILRRMQEDQHEPDFCAGGELIHFPVEIQPVDPMSFYGCGGWMALFNNSYTIL
jgi:hypothetical protein